MTLASRSPVEPDPRRLAAELEFVTQLCEVVASNAELQPILDWIVQKTTGLLSADEGSIKLLTPETGTANVKTMIRKETPGLSSGSWPPAVSMSVMGFLLHQGEALASRDILDDPRFPGLRGGTGRVRAVLAVPLKVGNRITGMLAVTRETPGREWTHNDTQLLSIVGGNSAAAIEQTRLRVEALEKQRLEEERRRMDRELNLAREIQMSLVPATPLLAGPWRTTGRVVPAHRVGGDAFDYFPVSDGRFGIAIADVSGKGIPAAILMSNVQASLRAFCDGRLPIREAIRHLNQSLARASASGKFVTLFYCEIDPEAERLRYVNAGHNYPLLRRAGGGLEELREGGTPLGIFEDSLYEQGDVPFGRGDGLMLYSDGISEAVGAGGEQFGEERLAALWRQHGDRPPDEVIGVVFDGIAGFRGAVGQSDDMTLVVVGARGD